MRQFVRWLFAKPTIPTTSLRVVVWWESRRIPFNLIVGVYGVVCLLAFVWAIGASGRLEPGEDAVEPIALLAAPFAINALYTLGWLVEVPTRLARPAVSAEFGVLLLKLGLSLGLALVTLPAGFWIGVRVLQAMGFAR